MIPEPIKKFIKHFSELPSIGPRQATRLAFYVANLGRARVAELAGAVADLQRLKPCPLCFSVSAGPCPVCGDERRRQDTVCVIEKETDLLSLEKTKRYHGRYLVLGELPRSGALAAEQKLKLKSLKARGPFEEIILAINPTTYGDLNAQLIYQEVQSTAKKITRLGRGLPVGGEIEFADPETLGDSLNHRS